MTEEPRWVGYGDPPTHPRAGTVLVLGLLGVVLCGVLAPFAWVTGNRTLREIDAQPGRWGGRDQVQVGRVLGIVGSVLLGAAVLFLLVLLALFLAGAIAVFGVAGL
ncbi:hypothetical protein KLP28_05245 [Nocardioidaceae bacterium]|nr:hypothetical protein KLP28_05245 [Nocardioidaceae bacterium]